MRIFLAAEVPGDIRKNISGFIGELKEMTGGVKWVNAENIHITLYFFGEVKENDYSNLLKYLEDIKSIVNPFEITIRRVSAFPSLNRPRVIWCGVDDGSKYLLKTNSFVKNIVFKKSLNVNREEKEFKPHLTIGRVKGHYSKDLVEKIMNNSEREFGSFVIEKFILFKSTLTKKGPIYEILKEYYFNKN